MNNANEFKYFEIKCMNSILVTQNRLYVMYSHRVIKIYTYLRII